MTGTVPRIRSLDGLRGLAAVIVLISHSLMTVPVLAETHYGTERIANAGHPLWIFTYTPVHALWAGTEAVYIFFILSGLVLALPVLYGKTFDWLAYYPRRITRLYLPVIAAVLLASAIVKLMPRTDDVRLGSWLVARPNDYSLMSVVQDMILLGGVSRVVSPLWSLRWEILFSLLLPLYIAFAKKWPSLWPVKISILVALIALGEAISSSYLSYLPMFAIGVLFATEWTSIKKFSLVINRFRNPFIRSIAWASLIAVAVFALTGQWILNGILGSSAKSLLTLPMAVTGACLLIFCAAYYPAFRNLLERSSFQWLGRISFSLYLTHEPIVIGIRFAFPHAPVAITICIGAALSIGVAQAFFLLIESRTIIWARSAGRVLQSLPSRRNIAPSSTGNPGS